jgi:hypothetical protein
VGWIRLAEEDERQEPRAGGPEPPQCPPILEARAILTPGSGPVPYARPSGRMPAALGYNGEVGYRITAEEGEAGVDLTDPEWRALVYVASDHGFSAPHLRLEEGEEAQEVEEADAEGLRSALGRALEARDTEEIGTPDGELAYDTIQRVRHVLLSEGVCLARTSG